MRFLALVVGRALTPDKSSSENLAFFDHDSLDTAMISCVAVAM